MGTEANIVSGVDGMESPLGTRVRRTGIRAKEIRNTDPYPFQPSCPEVRSYARALHLAASVAFPDADDPVPAFLDHLTQYALQKGSGAAHAHDLLKAMSLFDSAIAITPTSANAYWNRGIVNLHLHNPWQALLDFEEAVHLAPDKGLAWRSLGMAHSELGHMDLAEEYIRYAISLEDRADFRLVLGQLLLSQGRWEEGWDLYESRIQRGLHHPADLSAIGSVWQGESLDGKTILLHAEQGFGDTVQMFRFVPYLKTLGASAVNFNVHSDLYELTRMVNGIDLVSKAGEEQIPPFDYHCAVMSLGKILKLTDRSIPPPECLPVRWSPNGKARVGVCWYGRQTHPNDHNRSIPKQYLDPLSSLPLEYMSLQWATDPRPWMSEYVHQSSFVETVDLISRLSCVVTVDTVVAHLAGVLGVPTCLMLPFTTDWRWMRTGITTPWYPSLTLFRQPRPNDWPSVISSVRSHLEATLCSCKS